MELVKKQLKYRQLIADVRSTQEEAIESIVADALPDIARIVDSSAIVFIRDREAYTGAADLRLNARVTVLYVPEGENTLCRLELPVSFVHKAEIKGVTTSSELLCDAAITGVECRAVNPRKVSARVEAALRIRAYAEAETLVTTGVEADDTVQARTAPVSAAYTAQTATKNFTCIEELDIEGADLQEILKYSVQVLPAEAVAAHNKVSLKGVLLVSALYTDGNDAARRFAGQAAFSQVVDLPGAEEGMRCDAAYSLRSFELEPTADMSGQTKTVTLTAGLTADMSLHAAEEFTVVDDIYSTAYTTALTRKPLSYTADETVFSESLPFRERVETGTAVAEVLDWSVLLSAADEEAEEGPRWQALLNVLYRDEDGGPYSLTRRIPVTAALPDAPAALRATVTDDDVRIDGEGLQLQFTLRLEGSAETVKVAQMVESAEVGGTHTTEEYANIAMVLRFVEADAELWDIAKTYHTTCAAIRTANRLEPEETPRGPVLIPLKARKGGSKQ